MERTLSSLGSGAFRETLIAVLDEGVGKALSFLERFKDYSDDLRVLSHASDIVMALFDLGDRFPDDIGAFPFRSDGGTLIAQIVHQILRRVDRKETAYSILATAINAAKESLKPLVTAISFEDSAHGRFLESGDAQPRIRENQVVSAADLDILESIACRKIEEWAEGPGGGRLAGTDALPYVLYRWARWRDRETVQKYILDRLDPANFARLVLSLAENAGHHLDGTPTLFHPTVERLLDPKPTVRRILTILNGPDRGYLPLSTLPKLDQLVRQAERESASDYAHYPGGPSPNRRP